MTTVAVLLPLVPLLAACVFAAVGWNPVTAWLAPLAGLTVTAAAIALATSAVDHGPVRALGGHVRVDALSAFMLLLVGLVATITTTHGVAHLRTELERGDATPARARLYAVLVQLTITAMTVAVLADNLGVVWVAIETTTIATVLLVGHRRTRTSLEASWKYLVLGTVGVATALLGTVLVYFVSRHAGISADTALDWSALARAADRLDPHALRVGVGLVVVGYGTKAGLAPLHSWLPDAYSQAPAPVAALMAGALSALSMYALLRMKVIADVALGPTFVRNLLLIAALASLATAASLVVTQRDYKRLLAYSSVEHLGLVALAAAAGSPLAMRAALLHLLGNGLAKSVAFGATGEMLFVDGSTRIADVRGLLRRQPFIGTVYALALAALVGLPPFSILASEIAIVRAATTEGLTWAVVVALVLMLVIFTAITAHALDMLAGPTGAAPAPSRTIGRPRRATAAAFVAGLLLAAAAGITIWPIERLVHAAAEILAP